MRTWILAAAITSAAVIPAFARTDPLSDSQLVSQVSDVFTERETPPDRMIGAHKGMPVIIDVRCAGACPATTVRIIHYIGSVEQACTVTGGDIIAVDVPRGLTSGPEKFCIPHILVSRHLYTDRPYQR